MAGSSFSSGRTLNPSLKKGDLVRILKKIPLPQFRDEDVGKIGVVTEAGEGAWNFTGEKREQHWVVVLVDGDFRLETVWNLELVDETG